MNDENKKSTGFGLGFFTGIQLFLIACKLLGLIPNLTWGTALLPLQIVILITVVSILMILFLFSIAGVCDVLIKIKNKK